MNGAHALASSLVSSSPLPRRASWSRRGRRPAAPAATPPRPGGRRDGRRAGDAPAAGLSGVARVRRRRGGAALRPQRAHPGPALADPHAGRRGHHPDRLAGGAPGLADGPHRPARGGASGRSCWCCRWSSRPTSGPSPSWPRSGPAGCCSSSSSACWASSGSLRSTASAARRSRSRCSPTPTCSSPSGVPCSVSTPRSSRPPGALARGPGRPSSGSPSPCCGRRSRPAACWSRCTP